jgi:hypothetical protein
LPGQAIDRSFGQIPMYVFMNILLKVNEKSCKMAILGIQTFLMYNLSKSYTGGPNEKENFYITACKSIPISDDLPAVHACACTSTCECGRSHHYQSERRHSRNRLIF